jgi:hypothetical protein
MSGTISAQKRCSIHVSWLQLGLWGVPVLIMSIVLIYVCWCPTRLPYHTMFVSFNSNTTGATCGAGTANSCEAHELTPAFSGVRVSRSSVFCIKFCRSLFVLFFCHCVVCPTIYSSDYPFGIFKLFYLDSFIEELEDTRRVIRIHISMKNIQHRGLKKKYKRTNNDLQNIHIKLKIE